MLILFAEDDPVTLDGLQQCAEREGFRLLDRAWGVDYLPESRTVDQHIARLRKRIEWDSEHPQIIETVRNLGYRYQPEPPTAENLD